jgi:MATE family multidrug resistance protein
MGTTGTTAILSGMGDEIGVQLVLFRSLILGFVLGLLIFLLSPTIANFGFWLQAGDDSLKNIGSLYFHARIWDAPFTLMNYVFIGWLLGRGRSDLVLLVTIIGNVSNIVLDYYFLSVHAMTSDGVGYASAIAQVLQFTISFCIVFFVIHKNSTHLPKLSSYFQIIFKKREFYSLLSFNKDIFIRTALLIITFSLFRNFSSSIGKDVLTVNVILFQFMLIYAFFIDGTGYAMETISGELFGSGKIIELKKILQIALSFAVFIAILLISILILFPYPILSWISKEEKLIEDLAIMLPWIFPVFLLGGIAFVYDGLFLGLVKGRILRNSMLVSSVAFFLPVAFLGLYLESNPIIWISMSFYMLGRAVTLYYSSRKLLCTI